MRHTGRYYQPIHLDNIFRFKCYGRFASHYSILINQWAGKGLESAGGYMVLHHLYQPGSTDGKEPRMMLVVSFS